MAVLSQLEIARRQPHHARGLHAGPCGGERAIRIDAAAGILDDDRFEDERASPQPHLITDEPCATTASPLHVYEDAVEAADTASISNLSANILSIPSGFERAILA